MDAESTINTSMLENKFRDYIKQYRALLRWGVDKVFQDSRIDKLFNDARRLIDAKETEKASILLSDLKKQINYLENQYPDQKNEIEKELFVRIQQLESIIEKTTGISTDQMHLYLQTLEIARVSMQNDDWAEAKVKIEAVEMKVLTPQVIEKTRPGNAKNTSPISTKKKAVSVETPNKKQNNNPATQKPVVKAKPSVKRENESSIETNKTKTVSKVSVKTEKESQVVNKQEKSTPHSTSSASAQSLISTAEKLSIGRLITLQDLQKTLNTIDKSLTKNVRIGFFANFETINSELACFSKKPLQVQKTGAQIALLRLSISRELTIYLIGVPINEDVNFQQIINIAPQFSSLFISSDGIETAGLEKLSTVIPDLVAKNRNIFIKNYDNLDMTKIDSDKSAYTIIDNTSSRFIEDAAMHMKEFSGD